MHIRTRSAGAGLLAGLILGSILTMALTAGATVGDPLLLGTRNNEKNVTKLSTRGGLFTSNVKPGNPALILQVTDHDTPPLQVNNRAQVEFLNADMVDG